jgi:hypothetical protein
MTITMLPPLALLPLIDLEHELQIRPPRAAARAEIVVTSVPLLACKETITRLIGPRDAVLDYAAALFAEEATCPAPPSHPLTLEEAHDEDDGEMLSLLLSRGMYTRCDCRSCRAA